MKKPKIVLVAPVLKLLIDNTGFPFPFVIHPCYWNNWAEHHLHSHFITCHGEKKTLLHHQLFWVPYLIYSWRIPHNFLLLTGCLKLKDPIENNEIIWLKASVFTPKINLHTKGTKAVRKTEDKGNEDQLANYTWSNHCQPHSLIM